MADKISLVAKPMIGLGYFSFFVKIENEQNNEILISKVHNIIIGCFLLAVQTNRTYERSNLY